MYQWMSGEHHHWIIGGSQSPFIDHFSFWLCPVCYITMCCARWSGFATPPLKIRRQVRTRLSVDKETPITNVKVTVVTGLQVPDAKTRGDETLAPSCWLMSGLTQLHYHDVCTIQVKSIAGRFQAVWGTSPRYFKLFSEVPGVSSVRSGRWRLLSSGYVWLPYVDIQESVQRRPFRAKVYKIARFFDRFGL